ncbi:MAG: acetyltransferase [Gammaproteobacteria bacterium]
MFLQEKAHHEMIEILSLSDLFDPFNKTLVGRYQHGEEVQDPEKFNKSNLQFLSGEDLPECWLDAHYRDNELIR